MTSQINILENLVSKKRIPLLFVGSGLSKRYVERFPSWEDLLKECFWMIDSSESYYVSVNDPLLRDEISYFERMKKLGSIAERDFNKWYFENARSNKRKLPQNIVSGDSPFKMFISNRFSNIVLIRNEHISAEMELFKQLADKVGCVITTNYDYFLEKHFFSENFDVYINQSELFNKNSVNIRELYKIHGCISNQNSIVITEKDYDNFENNRKLTIAKMMSLFTEYPIIFLGYSMNDENIHKIILDFLSCLSPSQLENIYEHFVFVEYKEGELNLVQKIENIQTIRGTIPITKIETDNFRQLFTVLNNLTPTLSSGIIKKTKKLIKSIVDESIVTTGPQALLITTDKIESIPDRELAIALGYKNSIFGQYGYERIEISTVFEDVLLDNYNYNALLLVSKVFSHLNQTGLIPIHKYTSVLDVSEYQGIAKIRNFLNRASSYEEIYSGVSKYLKSTPTFNSMTGLRKYILDNHCDTNKAFFMLGKSISNFSISEIKDFCIEFLNSDKVCCFRSTYFKRAVMYYDFLKYGNKKYHPLIQDVPESE